MSPPFNLKYAYYLNELEGSLSVITISECLIDIWVLKDDKNHEEWALVESIVISQEFAPCPIAINRYFILLIRRSSIWVYCRRNKAWRKVHDMKVHGPFMDDVQALVQAKFSTLVFFFSNSNA